MKYPSDMHVVYHLDHIDEAIESIGEAAYNGESLAIVLLNYDQAKISDYDEFLATFVGVGSHNSF